MHGRARKQKSLPLQNAEDLFQSLTVQVHPSCIQMHHVPRGAVLTSRDPSRLGVIAFEPGPFLLIANLLIILCLAPSCTSLGRCATE